MFVVRWCPSSGVLWGPVKCKLGGKESENKGADSPAVRCSYCASLGWRQLPTFLAHLVVTLFKEP